MKTVFFSLLALMSFHAYTQESIEYTTPEQLADNIRNNTTKATVIQYWVPNCANADEIVAHYNELQNKYAAGVDFYFIGITNKKELVTALISKNGFSHKIYIADPSVNEDLQNRREAFSMQLCRLLTIKETDFITMYIDKKDKVLYYGDAIEIEKSKLKKVM